MAPRRSLPVWLLLAASLLATACAAPLASQGVSDTAAHHYATGMKFLETGELTRAQEEFERSRGLDPKYAPAYEGLGLVVLARGDLAAAESLLEESKSKDRKYVPAYLGLAKVFAAKGDLDQARREAEAARRIAPKNARVHIVLGQVYLTAFEFQRAEASFSQALELEPASAEARLEWDRSVKIRQAAPGTLVGKRIALADPITRGELAALLATELGIETHLRKRRPELFDPSFRPPGSPPSAPVTPETPVDLGSHWARNAIELVMRLHLMDAYPDRSFRPDEPVTRAGLAMTLEQVLAVVTNDAGLKTRHVGQTSPFPDVRNDHFAFTAAMVVTTRGLMEAERPSGAFRLANPVSGPEALLAIRKLAELF
jgi:Tfp pilus assembly protein PilF